MKMRKMMVFGLVVMLIAGLSVMPAMAGWGQGRYGKGDGMGKGMGRGMGMRGMFRDLNLTDDQKTEITAVLQKYQEEKTSLIDQMIPARDTLMTAIHAVEYNEAAVRDASKALAAVKEEMDVMRAKISSEIRPILTDEQIETLKEKQEQRKERRAERIERRMDRMEGCFGSQLFE